MQSTNPSIKRTRVHSLRSLLLPQSGPYHWQFESITTALQKMLPFPNPLPSLTSRGEALLVSAPALPHMTRPLSVPVRASHHRGSSAALKKGRRPGSVAGGGGARGRRGQRLPWCPLQPSCAVRHWRDSLSVPRAESQKIREGKDLLGHLIRPLASWQSQPYTPFPRASSSSVLNSMDPGSAVALPSSLRILSSLPSQRLDIWCLFTLLLCIQQYRGYSLAPGW